jgi:nucleoside-diphosphate-sugar epimerase
MYGIGQRRSMLIPRLVDNVRAGRPITLQKGQGICIKPVHVSDAVAMLQACTTLQGSRTINVAGPEKLSLRRIAEIIGMQVGLQPVFEIVSGEPADLVGSNELMSSILGRPLSRFEDRVVDVL